MAVARVLAAAHKIVGLDEPSVAPEPVGVRVLARRLVKQPLRRRGATTAITHALALVGGSSDRNLFLDPGAHAVVPGGVGCCGPCEFDEPKLRQGGHDREEARPSGRAVAPDRSTQRRTRSCPRRHVGGQRPTWTRELLCPQLQREGRHAVSTMGCALARIEARLGMPMLVVLCSLKQDVCEVVRQRGPWTSRRPARPLTKRPRPP